MKNVNITKIIKGLVFIVIGILFMVVRFYAISSVTSEGIGFFHIGIYFNLEDYWDEFFKPNIMNFVFSGLFILLGLIEFKEAIADGS